MTIDELLANLQQSNLVPAEAIRQLNQRARRAPGKFGARAAIQWLVDEGHITPAQGQRLLATAESGGLDDLEEVEPAPATRRGAGGRVKNAPRADSNLGPFADPFAAAPLEDAEEETSRSAKKAKSAAGGWAWDTPLILWGGGLLLLLTIAAPVLYWRLTTASAEESIAAADAAYNRPDYAQAVALYDEFLKNYPGHAAASGAKVNRGLAFIRQSVNLGSDWKGCLTLAKDTLAAIQNESAFNDSAVKNEIVALLPDIAEGLARQADRTNDPQFIEMANDALKQLPLYIPKTDMPVERINRIAGELAKVELKLRRENALVAALEEMNKLMAASQTSAAYEVRKALLKSYPELRDHERVRDIVASLSKADEQAIRAVNEARAAETAEQGSSARASVALATQTLAGKASGVDGEVVTALASGSAFGLDAANGLLLWSRYVGLDAIHPPETIPEDPERDLIVAEVDSVRGRYGLLRLASRTGELRWRLEIGEPFFARPTILGTRVVVSTRGTAEHGGRIVFVDLATGESSGYAQLTQELIVPAVGGVNGLLYQAGQHSNLYVIDPQGGKCLEVYYLEHLAGTIVAPPLVVPPYVFVAENRGAGQSLLRVFETARNGASITPRMEIQLKGQVVTPMQLFGSNLLVATDRLALHAYEILAPGKGEPLSILTAKPAEDIEPRAAFPLYTQTQLFVAGMGLARYDVAAARGDLLSVWFKHEGDAFVQTPRLLGETLYHARIRGRTPGVAVAALDAADGKPIWETQIGVGPLGQPSVDDSGGVTVLNAVGGLFEFSGVKAKGRQAQMAVGYKAIPAPTLFGVGPARLDSGELVYAATENEKRLLVAHAKGDERLTELKLENPLGPPPAAMGDFLLAPGQVGQVFGIDPKSGAVAVQPFQPPLEGVDAVHWGPPAITADGQALVADDHRRVFLLSVEDAPVRRLVAVKQANVPQTIASPIAIAGQTAYAVDLDGGVQTIALPGLTVSTAFSLDGARLAWGPYSAGNTALLATDDGTQAGKLICLEGQQKLWEQPLSHGALAGPPLADAKGILLATVSGRLLRIAAADGEAMGESIDAGGALVSGPVALGDDVIVLGSDGSVHVLPKP